MLTQTHPQSGSPVRPIGEVPARQHPLVRLWSIPATRALVALMFVLLIGCLFNADGAFFKPGTHRDALRQAADMAKRGDPVWIVNKAGERIGAIVSVERAKIGQ